LSISKKKRDWSSNRKALKSIPSPSKDAYEIKTKIPELTFMGDKDKPDFASLYVTFYPGDSVIELKSLKEYIYEFRNQLYSYERIINVIYDDLFEVYKPRRLRLVLLTNPRGGISSRLCIDSDWSERGGKEEFKDWMVQKDEW